MIINEWKEQRSKLINTRIMAKTGEERIWNVNMYLFVVFCMGNNNQKETKGMQLCKGRRRKKY